MNLEMSSLLTKLKSNNYVVSIDDLILIMLYANISRPGRFPGSGGNAGNHGNDGN